MMKMLSKLSKGAIVSMAALSMLAMPVMAEDFSGADLGSKQVPVTVTFDEADDTIAAKAMIPTSINIKGKTGTYHVMGYYEASEVDKLNATLSIVPSTSFTLTKGSTNITATVSQPKTTFTPSEIRSGSNAEYSYSSTNGTSGYKTVKEVKAEGTITANNITAGTWTGNLTFNISASK